MIIEIIILILIIVVVLVIIMIIISYNTNNSNQNQNNPKNKSDNKTAIGVVSGVCASDSILLGPQCHWNSPALWPCVSENM